MHKLRRVQAAAAPELSTQQVLAALRSVPAGSASGPCGLKPQHLKDAICPGLQDAFVRELSLFANLVARGEVPEAVREWFFGA
eukprot:3204629-Amphidinium_carterae.3